MKLANFRFETDADGVALVTWDMPGRSMNVIDEKVTEELAAIVERVATETAIKGAVLTSGKDAFCGGADLTMLETLSRTFAELQKSQGDEAANKRLFDESRKLSQIARRIETCGKPWVAAINGTAMGGGFEIALACHYRISTPEALIARLRAGKVYRAERVPAENRAINSFNCAIFFSRCAFSDSIRERIDVFATTISSYPPLYMITVS